MSSVDWVGGVLCTAAVVALLASCMNWSQAKKLNVSTQHLADEVTKLAGQLQQFFDWSAQKRR